MTTKFIRNADTFQLINAKCIDSYDELPGGNYLIRENQEGVLYLQMVENFSHPKKMYGDVMEKAARIRGTFDKRKSATGVLLSGEKGSGKTLLCRTICVEAAKDGIPTIIINAAWAGDRFFAFLAAITQPCIVLFDEFEKVYDTKKNEQDAILTLLDGVFPSRKLFLLTCNDRYGINQNMINRPGRIYYSLEFRGLEPSFIREYTKDNLKNPAHLESVIRATMFFSQFNFDMLQALIEEMNRYNEAAADALQMLNVSPVHDFANYKVNVLLGSGRVVENDHTNPREIRSPLAQKAGIAVGAYSKKLTKPGPGKSEYDKFDLTFFPADVVSINEDSIMLKNKDGDVLNLVKERFEAYNWRSMADVL